MPEVTPICQFGTKAISFNLKGIDEKIYNLEKIKGENGSLIMFICNHCPYVKGVVDRLVSDISYLQQKGIGCAAIMSNDVNNYPEDSFENMKKFSKDNNFTFPYLYDETQEIAKSYGAVCTPDFFGYNKNLELQYRGRLDNSGISGEELKDKELLNAFDQIIKSGNGPKEQTPSMGCSIKWK
tara:strand:- start:1962 stop:2507 length:546 start_codon:yes stop_codon:yes gene_type:complete